MKDSKCRGPCGGSHFFEGLRTFDLLISFSRSEGKAVTELVDRRFGDEVKKKKKKKKKTTTNQWLCQKIREFIYGISLIAVDNSILPPIRWYFVNFLVSF